MRQRPAFAGQPIRDRCGIGIAARNAGGVHHPDDDCPVGGDASCPEPVTRPDNHHTVDNPNARTIAEPFAGGDRLDVHANRTIHCDAVTESVALAGRFWHQSVGGAPDHHVDLGLDAG